MANVITPTNTVTRLGAIVFKANSCYVDMPFAMQSGANFSLKYYCPTNDFSTTKQSFGYLPNTSSITYRCFFDFDSYTGNFSMRYPTITRLFNNLTDIRGEHNMSFSQDQNGAVTLSVSSVNVWTATATNPESPQQGFCIGVPPGLDSYGTNLEGFKVYGFTLNGVKYVPAVTPITSGKKTTDVYGYYDASNNLFYHRFDDQYSYDSEPYYPDTPMDEFDDLFPTADVSTYSSLRYNDGDVPVEAYRVVTSMEALLASKTYEGELVSIVSDPANNGLWHILNGTPRRIGFVY